jgi:predicted DNA-binding transcriptional regulator YafY
MAFSRRTGLKIVLLAAFLFQICDAFTKKRADQLSVQEIEEELEVSNRQSTRASIA